MSAPRARANHSLYLARILLDTWRAQIDSQDIPARTLHEAFLPAALNHLRDAYGWFLLEIAQVDDMAATPPGCVADLPAIPAGRAEAGELRECRQLEEGGWLARLLAPAAQGAPSTAVAGSLASPAAEAPGLEEVEQWHAALGTLFGRMRDSLDEY